MPRCWPFWAICAAGLRLALVSNAYRRGPGLTRLAAGARLRRQSTQFLVGLPEAVLEWRRRAAAAGVARLAILPVLFGLAGTPDAVAPPPGP